MRLVVLALLFLLAVGSPHDAYAHISGGITKEIGHYRIQFVSEPEFPTQNERVTLLFNIQNATTGLDLYNRTVSVRIAKDEQIIKTFPDYNANNADVMLDYTFADAGIYTVSIEIASAPVPVKADFPVEVSSSSVNTYIFAIIAAAATGIVFLVIIFREKVTK